MEHMTSMDKNLLVKYGSKINVKTVIFRQTFFLIAHGAIGMRIITMGLLLLKM